LAVLWSLLLERYNMGALNWSTIAYNAVFTVGATGSFIFFILRKVVHHVIQENMETLATIKHEVTPNSGSSMKDKINATNDRLERVENQVDSIIKILMEKNVN
jgi:hypothetical protein